MKKIIRRLLIPLLAAAILAPTVAIAGHAPHYHDKSPAARQRKAERKACQKEKKMRAKTHHFH